MIFYKTNDVFEAEEKLSNQNIICTIVPTPVQDKAYCGVCLSIDLDTYPNAIAIIAPLEHVIVRGDDL